MRRHTLWVSLFPVILACSVACARSHSIEKRSKVCLPVVPFADVGSTVVCKNGIPRLVKGGCELGYRLLQSQYFDVCQQTKPQTYPTSTPSHLYNCSGNETPLDCNDFFEDCKWDLADGRCKDNASKLPDSTSTTPMLTPTEKPFNLWEHARQEIQDSEGMAEIKKAKEKWDDLIPKLASNWTQPPNSTTPFSSTTPMSSPGAPGTLRVSGACARLSYLNANFLVHGATADKKPYYQSDDGTHYLYFDKSCDGKGAPARWIFDRSEPSITAVSDLDGDGKCTYAGWIDSSSQLPPKDTVWNLSCFGTSAGPVFGPLSIIPLTPARLPLTIPPPFKPKFSETTSAPTTLAIFDPVQPNTDKSNHAIYFAFGSVLACVIFGVLVLGRQTVKRRKKDSGHGQAGNTRIIDTLVISSEPFQSNLLEEPQDAIMNPNLLSHERVSSMFGRLDGTELMTPSSDFKIQERLSRQAPPTATFEFKTSSSFAIQPLPPIFDLNGDGFKSYSGSNTDENRASPVTPATATSEFITSSFVIQPRSPTFDLDGGGFESYSGSNTDEDSLPYQTSPATATSEFITSSFAIQPLSPTFDLDGDGFESYSGSNIYESSPPRQAPPTSAFMTSPVAHQPLPSIFNLDCGGFASYSGPQTAAGVDAGMRKEGSAGWLIDVALQGVISEPYVDAVAGRLNPEPATSTTTPFIKSQTWLSARTQDMAPTGRPMTGAAALSMSSGSGSSSSQPTDIGNANVSGTRDFSPIGQTCNLPGSPTLTSPLVPVPILVVPALVSTEARLPRRRDDNGPTHAHLGSDVVYCTAEGVVGPDGPRSAVKINGNYTSWVLELGVKKRNVLAKSLKLSPPEKAAYVTESQKHKHRVRQLAYIKRNVRPGNGQELIP